MPGWQIALIAVGAALLAATVAVLVDRARAAHRKTITAAACQPGQQMVPGRDQQTDPALPGRTTLPHAGRG
jgi:hypothetical protein